MEEKLSGGKTSGAKLDARVPVGTAIEQGLAGYADHIETVFKVAPPVRLINGGFGCLGVLMRDPVADTVQCHMCGKWFSFMGTHLHHTHGVTATAYRKTYGLPRGFPLCGRSFSNGRSANILKRGNLWRKHIKKWIALSPANKKGYRHKPVSAARLNQRGLCPEQVVRRYEMAMEATGKSRPSVPDLYRIDPQLMSHFSVTLYKRGKTMNTWRRDNGFETREISKKYCESTLLAAIRKMARIKGRPPKARDFRGCRPGDSTITAAFGSWNRAMQMAGFTPNTTHGSSGDTLSTMEFRKSMENK